MFQVIVRTKSGELVRYDHKGFFQNKQQAEAIARQEIINITPAYTKDGNGFIAKLPDRGVKAFILKVNI